MKKNGAAKTALFEKEHERCMMCGGNRWKTLDKKNNKKKRYQCRQCLVIKHIEPVEG